ncbi:MAG: hypothetical protein U0Z17_11865 [Bacteroidales bacterium]
MKLETAAGPPAVTSDRVYTNRRNRQHKLPFLLSNCQGKLLWKTDCGPNGWFRTRVPDPHQPWLANSFMLLSKGNLVCLNAADDKVMVN